MPDIKSQKSTRRMCFLQFPDWKSHQALDPAKSYKTYGEYIIHVLASALSKFPDAQLVTFNSKLFNEYLISLKVDITKVKPGELSKFRAKWVGQLDSKLALPPGKVKPYKDCPVATMAVYGNTKKSSVEYYTVAVHWGPQVKDWAIFRKEDFDNADDFVNASRLYVLGFGIRTLYNSEELLEPEVCACCGRITYRVYNEGDDGWEQADPHEEKV